MEHVALVLPGRAYGIRQPVLRYPSLVLEQRGATVGVVDYPDLGTSDPQLPSGEDAWRRFDEQVTRTVRRLVEGAERVTVIAKSLGTRALAGLVPDVLPADTSAIWLTPLFGQPEVEEAATSRPWRSMFVFGTADFAHDPAAQARVTARTGGVEVAIDGGDHALEVPGDAVASAQAIVSLTDAVLRFSATVDGGRRGVP